MTHLQAIAQADSQRPCAAPDDLKGHWLFELETKVAELMEISLPDPPLLNQWPSDQPLLMPEPWDAIYPAFLLCKYDYYNQDDMYPNDKSIFEDLWAEASGAWRRHHLPTPAGGWKVM